MKTFVRPSALGLAMLNAAMKTPHAGTSGVVLDLIVKRDRPDAPAQSGYNRIEHDGIRVSQKTLASLS